MNGICPLFIAELSWSCFFLLTFNPISLVPKDEFLNKKSRIRYDEKAAGNTALSKMVVSKINPSACFQDSVAAVVYD